MAKRLQRRVKAGDHPCDTLLRRDGAPRPTHLQNVYGTFIKVFPFATVWWRSSSKLACSEVGRWTGSRWLNDIAERRPSRDGEALKTKLGERIRGALCSKVFESSGGSKCQGYGDERR